MSHGVKYFLWRNGRPRWMPGPAMRARGFRGKDLKDEHGHWLDLAEARRVATALNAETGVALSIAAAPLSREKGYVYFLFTDTEKVKIGFSTTPAGRVVALSRSVDSHVRSVLIVQGSRADEKAVHDRFFDERFKHEWFFATRRIQNYAVECFLRGSFHEMPSHGRNPVSSKSDAETEC